MNRRSFYAGIGLIFLVLVIYSLTFASGEGIVRLQGRVMEVDFGKNLMVVNERVFFWNPNTIFYNEKGSPIPADRLKAKSWVYIEGAKQNLKGKVVVEKIFLIPKYIDEKEKHLYPFIQ
ncbi:MAG: hypothetical protein ACUVWO_01720 [Thermodesulfobacteriota bacterium]